MYVHLKCERSLCCQLDDGSQCILSEGTETYMHFAAPKINIWMLATILELKDKGLTVSSDDGLEWNFQYRHLVDISDKMPAAVEQEQFRRLFSALKPIPHAYLPNNFEDAVRLLSRPYYKLSDEQLFHITKLAEANDCDILEDERTGDQYTWGNADGCIQLMPLAVKISNPTPPALGNQARTVKN